MKHPQTVPAQSSLTMPAANLHMVRDVRFAAFTLGQRGMS